RLKEEFDHAVPFRHVVIDGFLEPDFAMEVADAFPTFEEALEQGFAFNFVNERKKVQISDAGAFPAPVARLNEALAAPGFLADLEYITGIHGLLADPDLLGGGMHVTGPHGRLDVHLDFNYSEEHDWHRRLNILVYLNPKWDERWGGEVELWDRDVKVCHQTVAPLLNRCVIFETSDYSFHGVRPLTCPPDRVRKSFAAYYYTKEPPPGWDGRKFSTIFRARPDEWLRGWVLAPWERVRRHARRKARELKRSIVGGDGRGRHRD
ncbi:MAG TPA: 2OG-Fe(II) oxygenase, partial [Deltaproteobacteria bacterium]|nr:2OG-Fe(II) oxygenase [Deltaproteobacteria bacterium]